MANYHQVAQVQIEASGALSMTVDGQPVRVNLHTLSPRLAHASMAELSVFEVSPSGYGLHWPLLDEDISVDGLLGVVHHPASSQKSA